MCFILCEPCLYVMTVTCYIICMPVLLVKETALLVKEGQPRALYESRRDSLVPFMSRGVLVPFSLRRRFSYVQVCFMWYIVHVMCSLSFRLPVVDSFFLGSSSQIDKGKAAA